MDDPGVYISANLCQLSRYHPDPQLLSGNTSDDDGRDAVKRLFALMF